MNTTVTLWNEGNIWSNHSRLLSCIKHKAGFVRPGLTRSTSAGTCLHRWSWAGSGTLPARHHSGWSACGAHSTACETLPGTPSSRRTFFGIRDASELGRSPWAWAVPCSASGPPSRGPRRGQRPGEPPPLPGYAPSWPQQLMLWCTPDVVTHNRKHWRGGVFLLVFPRHGGVNFTEHSRAVHGCVYFINTGKCIHRAHRALRRNDSVHRVFSHGPQPREHQCVRCKQRRESWAGRHSVSHDRRVNTGLQDFYVADGRADGARCLSSVTDNQQRSGARRPERQPLRAAAGGRDGGLGDGRESDVLHADTDPESAGVSAEVCSQPEPAKSEGRDRFPHAVSGIYVFNELPFITDLHAVTNLFVVYESFETNVPHWWFSEIKENSKSFRNNIF